MYFWSSDIQIILKNQPKKTLNERNQHFAWCVVSFNSQLLIKVKRCAYSDGFTYIYKNIYLNAEPPLTTN